jgi:hydroxyethylthiazole kinase
MASAAGPLTLLDSPPGLGRAAVMPEAGHAAAAAASLERVRRARPLVHCITNLVAMDLSANVLLALGASPAMAHAEEEVPELTRRAAALLVNIGTLSPGWVPAMRGAATVAREAGRPWVLDPVGCGVTRHRGAVAKELLWLGPALIRGNASEILALAGRRADATHGLESGDAVEAAGDAAGELSRAHGCVVGVTGAVDLITDGHRRLRVAGGHPMLTRITALGCALSAVCAAFLAVEPEPLRAAAQAFAVLKVAGGRAAGAATGPGSLRVRLLDELYRLDAETLHAALRIA